MNNHIHRKIHLFTFAKLDTYKINAFPKQPASPLIQRVTPISQYINGCTYSYSYNEIQCSRLPTNHIFQGARVCFSYLLCSYAPLSITVFFLYIQMSTQFVFISSAFYNERLIHHLWLLFMLCVRSFVFSFPLMTLNHLL